MEDFEESYKRKKEVLEKNIETLKEKLTKAMKKYDEIKDSNVDRKEARLEIAKMGIIRIGYSLSNLEQRLEFLRPANVEDIEYRNRQYYNFAKVIERIVPDDLPLRFHGTSIYNARQIIEDGEISSSVDRLGIDTSYDSEGQISVTMKNTLDTTVRSYTDLAGDMLMPAGCIFVLIPKDKEDERAGESMLMGSCNFKEEPNRLYAVITTPENITRVREWMEDAKIDADKVYDFDSFAKSFEKSKDKAEDDMDNIR